MGLDMYLYARKYIGGWDHGRAEEREAFAKVVEASGLSIDTIDKGSPHVNVEATIGYWRKENAIHGWFVRECQEGRDECQYAPVERAQLETLRELCKQVIGEWKLEKQAGDGLQDVPADVQERAARLLAPQPGFFFGHYDIDEWYMRGLIDTVAIVDKALALPKEWSFIYHSSW